MTKFEKYSVIAGLAILGALAAPALGLGVAGNALVAGGIAAVAQGVQDIKETSQSEKNMRAVLAKKPKNTVSPMKQARDRVKMGLPAPARDKRIAGGR